MTNEIQKGTVIGEVTFKYTKSPLCRLIHADGVWGGNTPQGYIQMDFFAELHEIPESVSYDIVGKAGSTAGRLSEKQIVKRGLAREVQVEVVVTSEVAKALKEWLEERLAQIGASQTRRSDS